MYKDRKSPLDKLGALLFSKEYVPPETQPYPEVYFGDFSSSLPEKRYFGAGRLSVPPGRVYDVREYGAVPNDRQRLATLGINYAISLCAKNGGGVVLLSGGDYYCQTIELKSHVTLFIEKGSRLIATRDIAGYRHHALLYCENSTHITITGGGKICGEGSQFSLKPLCTPVNQPAPIIDITKMGIALREQTRFPHTSCYGDLVAFKECTNIQIDHIILENAAAWTCRIHLCSHVQIESLMIHNNRNIKGTKGLVLAGSSQVDINHCFISTGDDGICLKNALWMDCKAPMGHIRIKDCEVITRTNAFKIGSGTTADIFDVTVSDCSFYLKDLYPGTMCGITIASCDGAMVCDVTVENIHMVGVSCPLMIRLNNRNRAASSALANLPEWAVPKDVLLPADSSRFDWRGGLRRITVRHVTAQDIEMPVIIAGIQDLVKGVKCPENITLTDFALQYRKCREIYDRRLFIPEYAKDTPESWGFRNLPTYGLWARHVKGLDVQRFYCEPAKSTWKQPVAYEDIT